MVRLKSVVSIRVLLTRAWFFLLDVPAISIGCAGLRPCATLFLEQRVGLFHDVFKLAGIVCGARIGRITLARFRRTKWALVVRFGMRNRRGDYFANFGHCFTPTVKFVTP